MEPQHHLQQQQQPNEDVGSSSGNKSSFLCRQSSTRWTPTADQIRILKDLYYNNGVRSPSAEQIQRISARLRQYGKIEGKNVFYWFQNHKARERQKKRFSVETSMQRGVGNCGWKPEDSVHLHKYTNINPGISRPSSPSSHGVLAAGHGYGSLLMENSFRECSISAGGNGCEGYDLGWFGMDPYSSSYTPSDKRKSNNAFEEETPEIETLPLFPVHGEDIAGFCAGKPDSCWYRRNDERGSSRTSLELTLNSYAGKSPGST